MTARPSRRTFVRTFALFTAAAGCRGARWTAMVLADVQSSPPPDTGLLRIKLTDFPNLLKVNGSVRIGTSPIGSDNFPTGLFYPVIINRASTTQFWALDASCSHEGCTVPVYDPQAKFSECPCHGSRYSISGELLRGPAGFGLRQFAIHYDGGDGLTVELPDISFALQVLQVLPSSKRIQLQFIAFDKLQYELHYRRSMNAAWSEPLPFSLTPEGVANQTVVAGHADYAQVYVDQPDTAGFYGVSIRTAQV